MARRGSNKARSIAHEDWVSKLYGGRRTSNSGADDLDPGDVRTDRFLFECKTTGEPERPANSSLLKIFTKIADEAYGEGLEPAICLQYYSPDNILANDQGWVNFTLRLSEDDRRWTRRLDGCSDE
jgi:hypothetical protein